MHVLIKMSEIMHVKKNSVCNEGERKILTHVFKYLTPARARSLTYLSLSCCIIY